MAINLTKAMRHIMNGDTESFHKDVARDIALDKDCDLRGMMHRFCPLMSNIDEIYSTFVIINDWPSNLPLRKAFDYIAQMKTNNEYERELFYLLSYYCSSRGFETPCTPTQHAKISFDTSMFLYKYHQPNPEN